MDNQRRQLQIAELVRILLRRWWVVVLSALLFCAGGVALALLIPNKYRAELVLSVVQSNAGGGALSALSGGLSTIASLAGVNLQGGTDTNEIVAVLGSRESALQLIRSRKLMPILFPDFWNPQTNSWDKVEKSEQPLESDAVKYFDSKVRNVVADKRTGLITVSITWTDPVLATEWANDLVKLVDDYMRRAALADADHVIESLKNEAELAGNAEVRAAFYEAMQSQIQSRAMLRVRENFVLRVVDPVVSADRNLRVGPPRAIIAGASLLLGIGVGVICCFMIDARLRKADAT